MPRRGIRGGTDVAHNPSYIDSRQDGTERTSLNDITNDYFTITTTRFPIYVTTKLLYHTL